MREKIAPFAMALLLVTAGLAGPATGSATALWNGDECSAIDNFIHDVLTFQNVNENPENPCSTQYQINQALEEMKQSDANQTEVDIYDAAAADQANKEVFSSVYGNYLNDTESAAWMKMQVAVAEAYQNGSSESVARSKARQAIAEYYSVKQRNLIEAWDTSMRTHEYLRGRAANESGINTNFVQIHYDPASDVNSNVHHRGYTNTSIGLLDGSTATYRSFVTHSEWNDNTDFTYSLTQGTFADSYSGDTTYIYGMRVLAPNSNYDPITVVDFEQYEQRWNKIVTLNNNLQTEAETFVNATYDDFENGQINASEVISANTAMFEYGVRNAGEDEGFYNSVGALAVMGYDTPNLENSGVMNVSYQGSTYQGVVMAHEAPGNQWETGVTYNESQFDGPVFIATVEGNKIDIGSGKSFAILEMTNREGEQVETVETTKYVYKTANTSDVQRLRQDLTDLRAEIEAREPDGGGTGGGIGFNGSDKLLIGVAAAFAVYVFGTRS